MYTWISLGTQRLRLHWHFHSKFVVGRMLNIQTHRKIGNPLHPSITWGRKRANKRNGFYTKTSANHLKAKMTEIEIYIYIKKKVMSMRLTGNQQCTKEISVPFVHFGGLALSLSLTRLFFQMNIMDIEPKMSKLTERCPNWMQHTRQLVVIACTVPILDQMKLNFQFTFSLCCKTQQLCCFHNHFGHIIFLFFCFSLQNIAHTSSTS